MSRTLLFVIIGIVLVIVVGAGGFFFLQNQNGSDTDGTDGAVTQEASQDEDTPTPGTPLVTPALMVNLVVAVNDIPRGVQITPDMVTQIQFPALDDGEGGFIIPRGYFENPEDVIGRIARSDISAEQIVTSRHIVEPLDFQNGSDQLSPTGSDAAAVLDPRRVAVSLPIDAITSVAYALQPGDHVDVLVSMLFVDVDPEFQTILPTNIRFVSIVQDPETLETTLGFSDAGTGLLDTRTVQSSAVGSIQGLIGEGGEAGSAQVGQNLTLTASVLLEPSEDQRPRLVTQRTVLDAQVLWVGEFPEDGHMFNAAPTPTPEATAVPEEEVPADQAEGPPTETPLPPRPNIITLAVRPQDAVTLTYLAEAGMPMTFALRSARALDLGLTQPVDLAYIMDQFQISLPERASFAVEPAIRSIRELSLGNRISLYPQDQDDAATEPNTQQ